MATPLESARVPEVRVTDGLAVRVTVPVADVATLPYWSWAWTVTFGDWTAPAVPLTGPCENASWVAARALTRKRMAGSDGPIGRGCRKRVAPGLVEDQVGEGGDAVDGGHRGGAADRMARDRWG